MICSTTRVFAYQMVLRKTPRQVIAKFLFSALERFTQQNPGTQTTLVLDNATIHKTILMKNLAVSTKTRFLFTASHSPFMNPIEECFRFLKCKFRNKHFIDEFCN